MSLTRSLTRLIETKPVSRRRSRGGGSVRARHARERAGGASFAARTDPARLVRPPPSDTGRRAFLFGALAHILEMDDLHRESVTHPGCVVVPAAWAIAAQHGSSGAGLLARRARRLRSRLPHRQRRRPRALQGLAQHVDLRAVRRRNRGGHAARAARRADRLGARQRRHAIGGLVAVPRGRRDEQAPARRARRRGRRARRRARGARLHRTRADSRKARKDSSSPPAPTRQPERVLAAPEAPWQLRLTSIKPWPSCRHTHPVVDAALELHGRVAARRHRRGPHRNLSSRARALRPTPRRRRNTRRSSRCSTARPPRSATARVTLGSFDGRGARAARRARGADDGRRHAAYNAAYPDRWGARVTLRTTAGETLVAERPPARATPRTR